MRSISSIIDHTLTWSQPKVFSQSYELRFGDEFVATMTFPKNFSNLAMAHTADGDWSYERTGMFRQKILIRSQNSDEVIAEYQPNPWSNSGTLELPQGKRVVYRASAFRSKSMILTESGEELIHYVNEGIFRSTTKITMNRRVLHFHDLPMLVMFGFYLIVMSQRDSAAAATA
ncbi:MAG: hypothetical protein V1799_00135 [bacterium]